MNLFYLILATIPILAFVSMYLLREWKWIYYYAFINSLVFVTYLYVILFSDFCFFDQDQLGLKKIFLFLYCLLFHGAASFIFSLIYKFNLSKKWDSTVKS